MASVNQKQCAVQCWLEEYRSLRTLAESHLTTMRYLVIFNLTALGTIGGLVLSDTTERIWVALIIPILSPFIGFLVYLHSKRTSQIDNYIDRKIAKRIRNIASDTELFGWESYVREKEKKQNRFVRQFSISGLSILTFTFTSMFVLIFTAKATFFEGAAWQIILWLVGASLTVILIPLFMIDRDIFLGKETWFRVVWNRIKRIYKNLTDRKMVNTKK